MADGFRPGGADADPALTIQGRTISYGAFRAMVERVEPPSTGIADLAGLGVVDSLVAVFAAARSGSVVLVRPPDSVAPSRPELPAATFLVALTSGTSGRPRGLARSADSWRASFRPLAELAGLTSHDVVLLTGPLHSTLHLFGAVHTLWLGAHLTDDRQTATAAHAVPAVLGDLLIDRPPRLRVVVVAGAHLPVGTEQDATAAGVQVVEYYGAAELSFVAARVAPAPLTAFPGVQVRIVDGELRARSPYLALGQLPTSPGESRLIPIADADGFAGVGDLATTDAGGGIIVRGRGDAAITTGGHTVLAEDVEAVIEALPGVRAVAVVGLPHARLGQVLAAVVELAPDAELADIRAQARGSLTGAARPRRWAVVAALPRTDGGKIARSRVPVLLFGPPDSGRGVHRRPAPATARSER